MNKTPTFSLCHTTARLPGGWREAFKTWMLRSDRPSEIEYILAVDRGRENEVEQELLPYESRPASFEIAVNRGRRCAVDGWNTAAESSRGRFLITVSDDWMPPEHWDTELSKVLCAGEREALERLAYKNTGAVTDPRLRSPHDSWGDGYEAVVRVSTGAPDAQLLTFSLLTRAYYERYGYIFYPEYLGMFGDNDFTLTAERDGVIVDATHLLFPHSHPEYGTAESDPTYEHQHRPEAWRVGRAVMKKRWPEHVRSTIAVLLPGETFSSVVVSNWTRLFAHLAKHHAPAPFFGYTPNVYITRGGMAEAVLEVDDRPDLVLWLDADNILTPEQFDMLYADLEAHPEAFAASAWCWGINGQVSAGRFDEKMLCYPIPYEELMAGPEVRPIDWVGFPAILMRTELLVRTGPRPFHPFLSEDLPNGIAGEDTAFSWRARERGCTILLDRRVKVEHLKLAPVFPIAQPKAVEPELEPAGV